MAVYKPSVRQAGAGAFSVCLLQDTRQTVFRKMPNANQDLPRSMRVAKVFKENQEQITNIHYSNDGMNIITSSSDDQIIIYDCEKGTSQKSINSKKYGVDLIHFTQNKHHAVHASTKENEIIRLESKA